jgi:hypothetical protein
MVETPAGSLAAANAVKKSRKTDWDAIEIQYRAGIKSLRAIGEEFGVSNVGILKRAKREGWDRDLKAKIQARADAKVSAALVSGKVSNPLTKIAEAEIIEANSNKQAEAQLKHIEQSESAGSIGDILFDELSVMTSAREDFAKLGELLADPEAAHDKLQEIYRRVVGFSGRVDAYKKLVEARKTAIELERKVLRIKDDEPQDVIKSFGGIKVIFQGEDGGD